MDQATETCERKVYVVVDGEYSDYRIYGVFSCEEKAQAFINNGGGSQIEEWGLDVWRPFMGEWRFWMEIATGDIKKEEHTADLEEPTEHVDTGAYSHDPTLMYLRVRHGDRDRAVKIAGEHFARLKAVWEQAETLNQRNPYVVVNQFHSQFGNPLRDVGMTMSIARVLAGLDPLSTLPSSIHGECVRMAITSASKQEIA